MYSILFVWIIRVSDEPLSLNPGFSFDLCSLNQLFRYKSQYHQQHLPDALLTSTTCYIHKRCTDIMPNPKNKDQLRLCQCKTHQCCNFLYADRTREAASGLLVSYNTWKAHQQADHRAQVMGQLESGSPPEENQLPYLSQPSSQSSSRPASRLSLRSPSPSRVPSPPEASHASPVAGPSRAPVTPLIAQSSSVPSPTSDSVMRDDVDDIDVYDTS